MIGGPVLIALAITGLVLVVGGVLLGRERVVLPAASLALGGGLGIAGALAEAGGHHSAARLLLTAAAALALPAAFVAYPRLRWADPVDFVAVLTVLGAGVLTTAQWTTSRLWGPMGLVIGLALIARTWWRIERSDGAERRALAWLSLGVGAAGLIGALVLFAAPTTPGTVAFVLLIAIAAPAMYLGVARSEVVDVRGLIVHVVVFGFAGIVYLAAFVLAASVIEILADGQAPRVGALGIIGLVAAATLHPLQVALHGVVDELLFGRRPDPLGAAATVAGTIGDDPLAALRAIREALVIPYAAIRADGVEVAASGSEVAHTRTLPLALGDRLGVSSSSACARETCDCRPATRMRSGWWRRCSPRPCAPADSCESSKSRANKPSRPWRRNEGDCAATSTTDSVRDSLESRSAWTLSATSSAAIPIRPRPSCRPCAPRWPARSARSDGWPTRCVRPLSTSSAWCPRSNSRRPACGRPTGDPLRVTISAHAVPDSVAAAVEVAAYRIVMEALTNVARHSGSDSAAVRLAADAQELVIDVTDGGSGRAPWRPGVGIASMRERAAELGGSLTTAGDPDGGRVPRRCRSREAGSLREPTTPHPCRARALAGR